ncbi:hypothetical protein [Streptomyces sp. OV198]|uniref:hypothetical protein n=1 Tax=Streptomyces sp. OV198 TaxID=1882787 RepID=UPI00211C28E3|nr:hypothetical protein [Streptomyces sp. OV198]
MPYLEVQLPKRAAVNTAMLEPPLPAGEAARVRLERGPNISPLPDLDPLPDTLDAPVLFKAGDHVSTDEISRPAPRPCRTAPTSPNSPSSLSPGSTPTTPAAPPTSATTEVT